MLALTTASAELTGTLLQSLLFGVYLLLCIGNVSVFANDTYRRRNLLLVLANAALFVLITTHWSIQVTRLYDALSNSGFLNDTANAFFINTNDPRFVAKNVLYFAQTLMADSMMVYRLYIVWNRNWRIIIPSLVAITVFLVSAIIETQRFSQPISMPNDPSANVSPWLVLLVFMSLFDTFYITGLIAWRVWSLRRVLKQFSPTSSLGPVIQIVIESAVLYTSCGIFFVATLLARSPAQFIAMDIISPMIGISYALITVRSNFRHRDDEYSTPANSNLRRDMEMGPIPALNVENASNHNSVAYSQSSTLYNMGSMPELKKPED